MVLVLNKALFDKLCSLFSDSTNLAYEACVDICYAVTIFPCTAPSLQPHL